MALTSILPDRGDEALQTWAILIRNFMNSWLIVWRLTPLSSAIFQARKSCAK